MKTRFITCCLLIFSLLFAGCAKIESTDSALSETSSAVSAASADIPTDVTEDLINIGYNKTDLSYMSNERIMNLWYQRVDKPPENIQWAFQFKTPYYAINIPKITCNPNSLVVKEINSEIYKEFYNFAQDEIKLYPIGDESDNLIIRTKALQDEEFLYLYIYRLFYPTCNTEGWLYAVCYNKKEDRRVELADALKAVDLSYGELKNQIEEKYLSEAPIYKKEDIKDFIFIGFMNEKGQYRFLCYFDMYPEGSDGFNFFLCYDLATKEFVQIIKNQKFII